MIEMNFLFIRVIEWIKFFFNNGQKYTIESGIIERALQIKKIVNISIDIKKNLF